MNKVREIKRVTKHYFLPKIEITQLTWNRENNIFIILLAFDSMQSRILTHKNYIFTKESPNSGDLI